MGVLYVCDGCGHQAKAENLSHGFFKPRSWFVRGDKDGSQVACSRECIDKIAAATGKTRIILPI